MTASVWLPLTEYSSKHQVSISTLRRRIKAEDIQFQLADGRYLILDQQQEHRPSLGKAPETHVPSLKSEAASQKSASDTKKSENLDEPILTAANRLLSELKRAYSQILQEKEEQILQLKEEVSDLKTLVRVLESENSRLSLRK